ncbi:MAG: cadmium-translocating P-type ATPase [Candidatus Muproteobacteria bacterium RBG_16_62_13]|uniref:P-type Zn(2+) transporter n=1 Tax=Candidatus Muproteobacteria bacterium RBG_16_62_13 TaxID=1817756 RepID=A0A1F6T3L1_9PROT|nr:MAG: cadmium-translocating P-type ATPase [Candidatus Muproteobacteria bacterium RBG_16_62_13]
MKTTHEDGFDGPWWRYPPLRNALLSGLIAGTGFVLAHLEFITGTIEHVFYWLAIPLGGWHWTREGIEKLIEEKEVGIEILMIAATVGSAILGLWDEAAALVFLYGAAEGTEEYTYARTRASIRALFDLAPKEARVLRDGSEVTVPAESLKSGDIFVVRPGEALPTDGIIQSGTSSLDESPVTGESIPVDKGPGIKVFAASINKQGALTVEATAAFADNTLSKIIHLVEEAQERKGKAQQWVERFGRHYTPAVLAVSALFLLLPWLLDLSWEEWSLRAVVLLVAAAPCALIMSTPVAMAAGIGAAGKRGILIKGGAHLEHLGSIQVVAFDKTGTLTHGMPTVADVVAFDGDAGRLLSVATALEHYSEHPLARAIVERARTEAVAPLSAEAFEALTGAGVKARIDGEIWYIGNPDLFQQLGVDLRAAQERIAALQENGKTVVLVGNTERLLGLIALQDRLRAEAKAVIASLHALGFRTAMLTGDNARTAHAVARELGLDDVRAGLKPEEKVAAVQQLQKQYGAVLMVGDGVNDAPALAAATCGVAMGAVGTDAAIEAADVALMADDLAKVSEALAFGHKARRVSTQNIVFSLLILATMIPLAVAGVIGVAVTVLIHEASELLAVANGLRAGRRRVTRDNQG